MQLTVHVDPTHATPQEFAKVSIESEDEIVSLLDIGFSSLLERCKTPERKVLDFLLFASSIYASDKIVRRDDAIDLWTRSIELNVPVSDVALWDGVKPTATQLLSFLTGDKWELDFSLGKNRLNRPRPRRRTTARTLTRLYANQISADAVCLFSGGLDSLIGAIDWLESNPGKKLCLIAHYDGQVAGPKSDQDAVIKSLRETYKNRVMLIQVRVGERQPGGRADDSEDDKRETTFRSRSLLFLTLGLYVAASLADGVPILIPENGTIALNVPLTPSRRGSCSTRTAHPYFLNGLAHLFAKMGLNHSIENPLIGKTKGECAAECLNQDLLKKVALSSVSCAKRGHKRTWLHPAKSCGRCMPCIYRRASLHKIGLDTEVYGRDICKGEVDPVNDEELADDLRACLSFLCRNVSEYEIAILLMESGRLEIDRLPEYAATVARAMDEIRQLLKDKGVQNIKDRAGL